MIIVKRIVTVVVIVVVDIVIRWGWRRRSPEATTDSVHDALFTDWYSSLLDIPQDWVRVERCATIFIFINLLDYLAVNDLFIIFTLSSLNQLIVMQLELGLILLHRRWMNQTMVDFIIVGVCAAQDLVRSGVFLAALHGDRQWGFIWVNDNIIIQVCATIGHQFIRVIFHLPFIS